MLAKEVGVMTDMLQKAGFKVVVANVSGQPIEGLIRKLKPDLKLSEVKVENYAGFILPCMAVGIFPGPSVSPVAVSIVKQAVAKGKPVAAADGSVFGLAEADVLDSKRFALSFDPSRPRGTIGGSVPHPDPKFRRSYYGGSGVVQDGTGIKPFWFVEKPEGDCVGVGVGCGGGRDEEHDEPGSFHSIIHGQTAWHRVSHRAVGKRSARFGPRAKRRPDRAASTRPACQ